MKTPNQYLTRLVLCATAFALATFSAFGELTTFTVDPSQSSLKVTASLATDFGNIVLQEQASGSLTTSYEGTIETDLTSTFIAFVGGSVVRGQNSGDWQPGLGGAAGSAPANYGGQGTVSFLTAKAAMREILVDLLSGVLPITGESFPADSIVFGFPTNATTVLDWNAGLVGSGSEPLTSYSTNSVGALGTVATVGEELVLTIPVDYTGYAHLRNPDDLEYTLQGQLVARAPVTAPPLQISMTFSASDLVFNINTTPGTHYTILSRTNFADAPAVFDAFTATTDTTVRTNSNPGLPMQFFQVRED